MLILGGGPAGCATAIGLRRLGYRVGLVHTARAGSTCEGISARTLAGLRQAGLHEAASVVTTPGIRQVEWNDVRSGQNTEYLLLRESFDQALLEDAAAAGVELVTGRVRDITSCADQCSRVEIDGAGNPSGAARLTRFLVEARGRAAPAGGPRTRGPESIALVQLRQGQPGYLRSQLCSFANGWAWLACMEDGLAALQITIAAGDREPPKRAGLEHWYSGQLGQLGPLGSEFSALSALSGVFARGCTSVMHNEPAGESYLRVGDAAMAVDPLSGNGIFQSLSSALVAPAVINTMINRPDRADLARQFYQSRIAHSFMRFARTGRDFYRMESRWNNQSFWRQRQAWPDDIAAHADGAVSWLGVETRPVVQNGYITSREVAITSDQPLGVWHVAGIELAPLLQHLPADPEQRGRLLQARVAERCRAEPDSHAPLVAWLQHYRLL